MHARPPRVSVQLQQSCCCVEASSSSSSSSSWRQQSRQRPPASKMAWVGHTVQFAGPGPRHSRQELSQSSQAWPKPWWGAGERTDIAKTTCPDTQPRHEFYITAADSLLPKICKTFISERTEYKRCFAFQRNQLICIYLPDSFSQLPHSMSQEIYLKIVTQ